MHMGQLDQSRRRGRPTRTKGKALPKGKARDTRKALTTEYLEVIEMSGLTAFLTGTFKGLGLPTAAVAWRAAHQCRRRLEQMTHGPIPMVVVVETEEQKQRTNVHMLVAGIDHLSYDNRLIRSAWTHGYLKVDRPILGGAGGYLARKIVKGEAEWDRWPEKFDKALRRVGWLHRKRRREGITLYNAAGRPTNRKQKRKKRPEREVVVAA
jgi:hypothetical protein